MNEKERQELGDRFMKMLPEDIAEFCYVDDNKYLIELLDEIEEFIHSEIEQAEKRAYEHGFNKGFQSGRAVDIPLIQKRARIEGARELFKKIIANLSTYKTYAELPMYEIKYKIGQAFNDMEKESR